MLLLLVIGCLLLLSLFVVVAVVVVVADVNVAAEAGFGKEVDEEVHRRYLTRIGKLARKILGSSLHQQQ